MIFLKHEFYIDEEEIWNFVEEILSIFSLKVINLSHSFSTVKTVKKM